MSLKENQAGELASFVHENLQAVQMAGKLAQQETQDALELVRGWVRWRSAGIPVYTSIQQSLPHSMMSCTAPREEPGPRGVSGRTGPAAEGPE